jgi:hypothetical protein
LFGLSLGFCESFNKNSIDFTQSEKNGKPVFELWNHLSISKNKNNRFWKSIMYFIRQKIFFFFYIFAGVNSSTGQALHKSPLGDLSWFS